MATRLHNTRTNPWMASYRSVEVDHRVRRRHSALQRLARSRARRGGTVTLYRVTGAATVSTSGRRYPLRNQSWTADRRFAAAFGTQPWTGGGGNTGNLFAVRVPARSILGALEGKPYTDGTDFSGMAKGEAGRRGAKWDFVSSYGVMEFRPRGDRPDLRPRLIRRARHLRGRGVVTRPPSDRQRRSYSRARPALGGGN